MTNLQKYLLDTKVKFLLLSIFLFSKISADESFVYSAPKTGTHLLNKAIELLTSKSVLMDAKYERLCESLDFINYIETARKNGKLIHTHRFPPGEILNFLFIHRVKMLSIIRDPRDQLISLIYHQHRCKAYLDDCVVQLPDPSLPLEDEQVRYLLDLILVENLWPYKSYQQIINDPFALQFLDKKKVLVVKFEDLIGEKGGGSNSAQKQCLRKICKFLNIPCSSEKINFVAKNLFGGT